MISAEERERYERQIMLFGKEGQERLKGTSVFVAGAGGLGSAVLMYLAAAGIGRIRIADHDRVQLSNLNRQILYGEQDLGKEKASSASERLGRVNPHVHIEVLTETLIEDNAAALLEGVDVIVDALDNWPTRYVLNKAALGKKIPLIHGAVQEYSGQVTVILPGRTPCLHCLFPSVPQQATFPIVGAVCGIIGSLQALEAIKHILNRGSRLINRLLLYDGFHAAWEEMPVQRNPECKSCGKEG